jgi:hypothetical protein
MLAEPAAKRGRCTTDKTRNAACMGAPDDTRVKSFFLASPPPLCDRVHVADIGVGCLHNSAKI